jgi:3-phenylpropionate/trans-cinnamate dioxygenase ferredoxin subunit
MFVQLERLINLDEGYRRTFQVGGRSLHLLVLDNQPLLFEDSCPHQGASLSAGTLSGNVLRCKRHGMEFQLPSGHALQPSCPGLSMLDLIYDGDRVGVEV